MKRIDIDVATDGAISIDAVGFSGPDCEQATQFLEEALGDTASRRHKPEHRHRRAGLQRRQSLGAGEAGS